MPEGDRPGVVADGAQAERQLAERLAAGQRLQRRRDTTSSTSTVPTSMATASSASSVGAGDHDRRPARPAPAATSRASDVDEPATTIRTPTLAGGRSSATASPVTRSSSPSERSHVRHRGSPGTSDVGRGGRRPDTVAAWTSTPTWPRTARAWRRLEELQPPAPADRRRGRRAGRRATSEVATHLSVVRSAAPGRQPGRLPVSLLARARNRSTGTRTTSLARRRALLRRRRFPAALYRTAALVARRRWRPTSWSPAVMMCVAGRSTRGVEQSLLSPGRGRPAGQLRLRGLLQRVRRLALRRPGVDQQRLGRGAVHRARGARAAGGLPAARRTSLNVAVIGSLMIQPRPGRAVLRADPAARAARADRGLRGRRRRAAAVLVVGRARARAPGPSRSRARAGRAGAVALGLVAGAAGQRGDRGVRDAVGAADLGPGRHRRPRRGCVPRLRVRARPAAPSGAGAHRRRRRPTALEDTASPTAG